MISRLFNQVYQIRSNGRSHEHAPVYKDARTCGYPRLRIPGSSVPADVTVHLIGRKEVRRLCVTNGVDGGTHPQNKQYMFS